ncbi:DUF6518 family protein [Streptomyces sp. NPDC003860]
MTALAAGATLGVLAPLLAAVSGSVSHAAHLVLAAGWTWAALAFCVGLSRKSRIESVVLASVSLLAAVIAYYLVKLGQGEFLTADLNDLSGGATQVSWASFLSKTLTWGVAACFFGPILGLAGNLARNRGFRGLPFRVLVPLVAIIETSERLRVEAPLQGPVVDATWSVILIVAAAIFAVLVGHTVITRWPRPSAGQTRE